jgi:hypothetical protein
MPKKGPINRELNFLLQNETPKMGILLNNFVSER